MVQAYFKEIAMLDGKDVGLDLGLVTKKTKFFTNSLVKKNYNYKLIKIVCNNISYTDDILNKMEHYFSGEIRSISFNSLVNKIKHYTQSKYGWNAYEVFGHYLYSDTIDENERYIIFETKYDFLTVDSVLINLYHIYTSPFNDTSENVVENWHQLFS